MEYRNTFHIIWYNITIWYGTILGVWVHFVYPVNACTRDLCTSVPANLFEFLRIPRNLLLAKTRSIYTTSTPQNSPHFFKAKFLKLACTMVFLYSDPERRDTKYSYMTKVTMALVN